MLLTVRQIEILRFIRDFRKARGIAPTLEEIAREFGVSKITVHEHLRHLEEKGAIQRLRARARGIQLLRDPDAPDDQAVTPSLPVLGRIAAGSPLEAIESPETVRLDELIPHGPNHYLLEVHGDSMVDAHILDGDWVVVERRETARNGETVVAILEDNEATLKRFYREKDHVRLEPANPAYPPIVCREVEIRGVVVGVVRRVATGSPSRARTTIG